MRDFAALYRALDSTTSTRARRAALAAYFSRAMPADAAWAVYFLCGSRPRQAVPVKVLRAIAAERAQVPEWLFEESYQAVGDLAETIALLLPPAAGTAASLPLHVWVEQRLLKLRGTAPEALAPLLNGWWDELDAHERFVWNKLITGGFRVGVSRQLVVQGVSEASGLPSQVVAERLAGDWRPDAGAWLRLVERDEGTVPPGRPYPFFLAHALPGPVESLGERGQWAAEWKWDGIRAQVVRRNGETFLWSRGEELVTPRFPEVAAAVGALPDGCVLDGELVAWRDGRVAPFALLQQRIGRTKLSAAVLARAPVAYIAYDLLEHAGADLRTRPFSERRALLEAVVGRLDGPVVSVSPLVEAATWHDLARLREDARARSVEGLMLKRIDSAYGIGRTRSSPAGEWWKWKLDPLSIDAVLVYAQRGHGRRASLYTDYTFALWHEGALVPFAKAYSGLSDAEIAKVDACIRQHTVEKFGPVRSVTPTLVCEIGFEGIAHSPRHKSGIAVRFPRILRLREDKRVEDADTLGQLRALAATLS
ncbi:MAG: ATP-dependent DNA ligase [Betaproteobacteria bacterium]|jgi:DNA ligase-1|nr:ATP-dependent DNA ligase [Betaproteobacteria bacterium]